MSTPVDHDESIRADFLAEAGELLAQLGEQLVALERNPGERELLNAVFRGFHTIKGGAGFLALHPMVELCHAAEDVFNALRSGATALDAALMDQVLQAADLLQRMLQAAAERQALPAAPAALVEGLRRAAREPRPAAAPAAAATAAAAPGDAISDDEFEALLDQYQAGQAAPAPAAPAVTAAPAAAPPPPPESPARPAAPADNGVRVDTAALDAMMNLVGELVLVRNRMKTLVARDAHSPAARATAELDHITRGLQSAVMRVRMQPIRKVFSRFPRVARDVARALGKQVEVELAGEDTGLDKNLVEALADPLLHMVRNSVDHGIETPERRLAAGKPAAGRLRLAAQQAGEQILITVSDDGAGIDAERLRAKAVEKGAIDAASAAALTPAECLQLVFLPGFSTKEQVSDLSGRGVGMDVVKSAIVALGGSVQIDSRPGFGTDIRIRVPLTLAILPALMVGIGERVLALPLAPVLDVFVLDPQRLRRLDRWQVVLYRGETLRLIDLQRWLEPGRAQPPSGHVVVAQMESERIGFIVSRVYGREEVVIKPLGALLRGLAGLAGATVTGSGRVALILDLPGVSRAAAELE
ncbi:MAG TPA: chemotaxis protein CheA [Nevskia sp.]|nr:chemotaxis protein CheA [Nevskia sp.]